MGGQDWTQFLQVTDGITYWVAKDFRDLTATILSQQDLVQECRERIYRTWVSDYLDKELQKLGKQRSFATFLHDRLRDHLRDIRSREVNRQQLLAERRPLLPTAEGGRPLWSAAMTSPETFTFLREVVSLLPANLAEIVELLLQGWTPSEIATYQRVSQATISHRLANLRVWFMK
jgi:DNA-directed RNA polymerase specialized sigma24 family protein